MLKSLFLAASLMSLAAMPAYAVPGKQCRDAKGRMMKCADKTVTKTMRCKDTKGHFAKCGAPGAKPM